MPPVDMPPIVFSTATATIPTTAGVTAEMIKIVLGQGLMGVVLLAVVAAVLYLFRENTRMAREMRESAEQRVVNDRTAADSIRVEIQAITSRFVEYCHTCSTSRDASFERISQAHHQDMKLFYETFRQDIRVMLNESKSASDETYTALKDVGLQLKEVCTMMRLVEQPHNIVRKQ